MSLKDFYRAQAVYSSTKINEYPGLESDCGASQLIAGDRGGKVDMFTISETYHVTLPMTLAAPKYIMFTQGVMLLIPEIEGSWDVQAFERN